MDSNSLILMLFLFQLNSSKPKPAKVYSNNLALTSSKSVNLSSIVNFLNELEIDPVYTREKIKIARKVGPYLPEKYIDLINQSMHHAERIIKINELMEFLNESQKTYIEAPIAVNNTKDRLSKIVKVVQSETSDKENKDLGVIMDLIVNMDKYKKIFSAVNTLMNSDDPLENPDKLIKMVIPILGENEVNGDKLKEMSKMLEIVKALNIPNNKDRENADVSENT